MRVNGKRAALASAAGVSLTALALAACTVQPIGWQGAGRLQTLPSPMTDGGGAQLDSGHDAGVDSGVDSGDLLPVDGGDSRDGDDDDAADTGAA